MARITYFRQQRVDDGIRTGIDLDGVTTLELFHPGRKDSDPALAWFVDVDIEGARLSIADANEARDWLLQHEPALTSEMLRVADDVETGIDDVDPVVCPLGAPARGIKASLRLNGLRRASGQQISKHIRDFAKQWRSLLNRLQPLIPV